LLQTGDRIAVAKSQPWYRTGGHGLQLRRADVGQAGIGKCCLGVRDERLGGVLIAEKVKDEAEHGGHLQRLSRLSESSSPDSRGDL
jgi:hypothetical protein